MAHRILIIEDDLFIRELYAEVLGDGGYEVRLAEDALKGLEILQSEHIDLVLLDIMMPGETGLEFIKKLKSASSTFAQVPIYVLSNLGQESVIREAFRLGAIGYLLKAKLLPKDIVAEVNAFFAGVQRTPTEGD